VQKTEDNFCCEYPDCEEKSYILSKLGAGDVCLDIYLANLDVFYSRKI
jgi:hypothetical protein